MTPSIIVVNKTEKAILEALLNQNHLTYKQIVVKTKLPESTIFRNINKLISKQLVKSTNSKRISLKGGPYARVYTTTLSNGGS